MMADVETPVIYTPEELIQNRGDSYEKCITGENLTHPQQNRNGEWTTSIFRFA
jgi:hypothetical protein